MKRNQKITILKSPSHISFSIIMVDFLGSKDFLEETHSNYLDEVSKVSDLFLIFPKSILKRINPKRFSSLYGACGYGECPDDQETHGILEMTEYIIEIFKKHLYAFYISDLEFLENLNIGSDFLRIQGAKLEKSVFSIERLSPEDMSKIYLESPKPWYHFENSKESMNGMFCTHSSSDSVMFCKVSYLKKILDSYDDVYFDTFSDYSWQTFMASTVFLEGLPENLINHSIIELLSAS